MPTKSHHSFLPPRRLSQPVAKAQPVTRKTEDAKRKLAAQSSLAQHRRRGARRGGSR